MSWRHGLSHEVNELINNLVRTTQSHKEAFAKGRNIRTNQLWCALAEVHSELRTTQERLAQTEAELIKVRNTLKRTGEHLTQSQ